MHRLLRSRTGGPGHPSTACGTLDRCTRGHHRQQGERHSDHARGGRARRACRSGPRARDRRAPRRSPGRADTALSRPRRRGAGSRRSPVATTSTAARSKLRPAPRSPCPTASCSTCSPRRPDAPGQPLPVPGRARVPTVDPIDVAMADWVGDESLVAPRSGRWSRQRRNTPGSMSERLTGASGHVVSETSAPPIAREESRRARQRPRPTQLPSPPIGYGPP
jgi:hypothetical protein